MGPDPSPLLKPAPKRILEAMLAGATSLTEIAKRTRMSKPALVPHLKALVALGLVEHQRLPTSTGSEARYTLRDASLHISVRAADRAVLSWATVGPWDPALPLLAQIPQADVRAEVAAFLHALRRGAGKRGDDLVILLFGSGARGEATWKSDLDLLVLVPKVEPALQAAVDAAAFEAETASQHTVRPTLVARADFDAGSKRIYEEAAKEGLIVWAPRGENAPWSTMQRYKAISP